ncbi:Uncharacterized protein HZ326_8829 [Fusarium oxysporum f. sp. albedinis]|nr:Uncharacterized protein HZ326_8829 [Fusarium oxysporum f. sp. albedinis]
MEDHEAILYKLSHNVSISDQVLARIRLSYQLDQSPRDRRIGSDGDTCSGMIDNIQLGIRLGVDISGSGWSDGVDLSFHDSVLPDLLVLRPLISLHGTLYAYSLQQRYLARKCSANPIFSIPKKSPKPIRNTTCHFTIRSMNEEPEIVRHNRPVRAATRPTSNQIASDGRCESFPSLPLLGKSAWKLNKKVNCGCLSDHRDWLIGWCGLALVPARARPVKEGSLLSSHGLFVDE